MSSRDNGAVELTGKDVVGYSFTAHVYMIFDTDCAARHDTQDIKDAKAGATCKDAKTDREGKLKYKKGHLSFFTVCCPRKHL